MRFDLVDLRLFLAVVETGSITHGAARSALSLGSASARIKGLEEALGVGLLERGPRGASPTAAGRALAHHAALVMQQLERMAGEMADHAGGLKGRVRLLANTAAASEFLPDLLASWLAENPSVDVELEERPSHVIVDSVADGTADAGIVADWANAAGLQVLPFRLDRLVLVVPRGHRLARRRAVAFAEVLDSDFVGLAESAALQEHLSRHAASARRKLRMRVRVRSFDAVCSLVARGAGLGVVPRTAADRCRRSMAITPVALSDGWAERRLGICVRDLAQLPSHARRLVAYLATAGAERGRSDPADGDVPRPA